MATNGTDRTLYGDDAGGKLYVGELELLSTWEVAFYLGIEKSRIARWIGELEEGKPSIAPPVARLRAGPVWTLAQVREKARQMYEQTTGKPPRSDRVLDEWLKSRRDRRAARVSPAAAG